MVVLFNRFRTTVGLVHIFLSICFFFEMFMAKIKIRGQIKILLAKDWIQLSNMIRINNVSVFLYIPVLYVGFYPSIYLCMYLSTYSCVSIHHKMYVSSLLYMYLCN